MRRSKAACALGALASAISFSAVAATSGFSAGDEGWIGYGDVQGPLTWSIGGGNPGGYVYIDDLTTGGVTYFVAPAAYLGNQSALYGDSLSFDLRQDYPGGANQFDYDDVIIQNGGLILAYDLPTNPANGAWSSYVVPLNEAGWHVGNLAGVAATAGQMQAVLANVTSLWIRAEYQTGADTGSLDNVVMGSAVPEPAMLSLCLAGGALVIARRRKPAPPADSDRAVG